MRERVLLVGSSFSAAPLLDALKSMGKEVAVCGNLPTDPCVTWADAYYSLDYSDPQALADLVKTESFSALCPSCNDYSYLAATAVASMLGLPGFDCPETTSILHNKARFRDFAMRHGIPVPRAWILIDAENWATTAFPYPLLVKPTDSFSGRGICKVESSNELAPAIEAGQLASQQGKVLVEEFIDGTLHSHSAFLSGQIIAEDFFVDEFCTVYPYQVNCSNSPSHLSIAIRNRVRDCITEIAQLLSLTDGLLHTQFMVRGHDIYIVECMRRCPGDLYYHLVSLSTQVAYIQNYLRPFLGEVIIPSPKHGNIPWARHTISLPTSAIVWSLGHKIPSSEVRLFPLRESGSLIGQAPYDKSAIIFARFDDQKELFRITPDLHELITLDLKAPHHAQHS